MNLQEYDIVELRACYAVLPPYFLLDATPGHENEKKNWREMSTLKNLVAKEELGYCLLLRPGIRLTLTQQLMR